MEGKPKPDRLIGLDVARALAYLGMVIVNFRIVMQAPESMDSRWLNTFFDLFSGRAAATFVTLAGIGLVLLWENKSRRQPDETAAGWRAHLVRHTALWLYLVVALLFISDHVENEYNSREVGEAFFLWSTAAVTLGVGALVQAKRWSRSASAIVLRRVLFLAATGYAWQPLWPGDILHFYAFYFLCGLALLRLKGPGLIVTACLILAASIWARFQWSFFADWELAKLHYKNFFRAGSVLRSLFYNGFHPLGPWLCFFILGMGLARLQLRNRRVMWALVAWGCVFMGGARLGSWLHGKTHDAMLGQCLLAEDLPSGRGAPLSRCRSVMVDRGVDGHQHRDLLRAARRMNLLVGLDDDRPEHLKTSFHVLPHDDGARLHIRVRASNEQPLVREHFDDYVRHLADWVSLDKVFPQEIRWPDVIFPVALEPAGPVAFEARRLWLEREGARNLQVWNALGSLESLPPGPLYILSAAGTALLVIGLCLLLASRPSMVKWLVPLVRTGQMALTLYVAHILVGLGGAELVGRHDNQSLAFVTFWILLAQVLSVIFATFWRRIFSAGPLEQLMRFLAG